MKSKKTIQRNLFTKQNRLTDLENKLTDVGAGEEWGEGIVEFVREIYTLLCLNWVTNKNPLYRHGALLSVRCQPG